MRLISIRQEIEKRQILIEKLVQDDNVARSIYNLCDKIIQCFEGGNKLIFCGNGGSAADCQHIVAEFVVKLSDLRKALPAISLTSNNSIITAISNDIDANYMFARQIEAIAKPKDILIGISTSGNSQNIINAFQYANKNNIYTVSVTGKSENKLKYLASENIIIPSCNTQIIQETYIMIFHIICVNVDKFYSQTLK